MSAGKLTGLILCILLILFTGSKLRKMFAIRDWLAGASFQTKVITGKQEIMGRHGPAYWIAWDGISVTRIGNHRINLNRAPWESISVGDKIEICYVGNDPTPYLRNGICASTGNIGFDIVLLFAELSGVLFCAATLFKKRPNQPSQAADV